MEPEQPEEVVMESENLETIDLGDDEMDSDQESSLEEIAALETNLPHSGTSQFFRTETPSSADSTIDILASNPQKR